MIILAKLGARQAKESGFCFPSEQFFLMGPNYLPASYVPQGETPRRFY